MNLMLSTPIETARLRIRQVEQGDLEPLMRLHGDAEGVRYIPHMHWANRADADAWWARALERREKKSAVQCVVLARDEANTGAAEPIIGTLTLFNFAVESGLAEFGYLLGRAHQKKGYAREAATAFIDVAFAHTHTNSGCGMGLRRLEATVDARNLASNQLAERLGFVREGVLRERWLAAGELQDIHLFGLLHSDWKK
jgi:[ribosomal protein S5]-alanine N-acetyltransferase